MIFTAEKKFISILKEHFLNWNKIKKRYETDRYSYRRRDDDYDNYCYPC